MGYTDQEVGELFNLSRQTVNTARNNVERLDAGETSYALTHKKVSDNPTPQLTTLAEPPDLYRPFNTMLHFANRQKQRAMLRKGKRMMTEAERNEVRTRAQQLREAIDDLLGVL